MILCKAFVITCLTLLSVISATVLPAAQAQDEHLVVQKKLIGSWRFTQGDEISGKVYNFMETAYHYDFKKVLERDPIAYAAAQKGLVYNRMALGGNFLILAGTTVFLVEAIKGISPLSSNNTFSSSSPVPLVLMGLGFVASVAGSQIGYHHMKNGVAIYNSNHSARLLDPEKRGLRFVFNVTNMNERIGVGMTLAW